MKRKLLLALSLMTALVMFSVCAMADTISMNGTVTSARTAEVYATIGGTVSEVKVSAGETVKAGDVLATLKTTKVYATEAGTVTGVFGQVGDEASTVSQRYGAVMYVEGEHPYTISASTDDAYNATANKFVHVGESVLLKCVTDSGSHTGNGIITAISGTDYTVEVTSGTFTIGESVNVFRTSTTASNRIGKGTLSRVNPTSYSGSGSIVSYAVKDGDTVQRGDLLFETLDGTFDGFYMSGTDLCSDADGVIYQLNLQQGSNVQKDSVIAVVYPNDAMRIEASVSEEDLMYIKVGDPVVIELTWNQDEGITYEGTVTAISSVAASSSANAGQSGSSDASYTVYVSFTPDENTRYGMTAVVYTVDAEEPAEEETEADTAAETEAAADETAAAADGMPTPPSGDLPADFNGELPEGFTAPEGTVPGGTVTDADAQ